MGLSPTVTKSFSSEPEGVTGSSSTVGKTALEADAGIGDKRVARNLSIFARYITMAVVCKGYKK